MKPSIKPMYCPALRLKKGEMEGVRLLTKDIAVHVLPRFMVVPQSERNDDNLSLFAYDDAPNVSLALSTCWRDRPALVDLTFVIDEYGRDTIATWLPKVFHQARDRKVRAIPMAMLADLDGTGAVAFRDAIDHAENLCFVICIPFTEVDRTDISSSLANILSILRIEADKCGVIIDFGGGYFDNPMIAAPIINSSLEAMQKIGTWQRVIFQGTHFPSTNPAKKDGELAIWPRNEWIAWKEAIASDPSTADHMMFGDYAADSAKMNFDSCNAQAIRHLRWATSNSWLVQRGAKCGSDAHRMRGVFRAIVASPLFSDVEFSHADAYIYRAVVDPYAKTGNPTIWRQLNTTHHITQVVSDIAEARGIYVERRRFIANNVQLSLTRI